MARRIQGEDCSLGQCQPILTRRKIRALCTASTRTAPRTSCWRTSQPPAACAGTAHAALSTSWTTLTAYDDTTTTSKRGTFMSPAVNPITDPVWLGEGPHWDHQAQALYFVSIFDGTVHKFVDGNHHRAKLNGMPTFIIPIEGKPNHFAVGLDRKVVEVEWHGGDGGAKTIRTIAEVDMENPKNRFNDAKADPKGRLFAGTMGHEYEPGKFNLKKGSLYRFEADGTPQKLVDNIDISNGLCWDVADKAFYFIDSFEYTIRRYDYDLETGEISNPRNVFSMAEYNKDLGNDEKKMTGIFDGMTIDTEGNLWVANFDGYQVLKIDPKKGKLLQVIPIPALQVTSATFGGPELDILFVTTASMNRGQDQLPPAGATFAITNIHAKGHPNNNVVFN